MKDNSCQLIGLNRFVKYLTDHKDKVFIFLCWTAIITGFLFRIIYVCMTEYNSSPHDIGIITGFNDPGIGFGNSGYIEYFCKFLSIPDIDPTTKWSFYNPPLFYAITGLIERFFLNMGISYATVLEIGQLIPCICIGSAVIGMYNCFRQLKITRVPLLILTVFVSFFPGLSFLSSILSNDAMMLMFVVWSIYFTFKWMSHPKYQYIIGIALCVGLGMLTKINAALIAPGIALVFLIKFIKSKKKLVLFLQYIIFGVICIPVGLFWSVRNSIIYKIPYNYVQSLSPLNPQNVSNISFVKRIGFVPVQDLVRITTNYGELGEPPDYNIWMQLFRTAAFDDNSITCQNSTQTIIAQILLVLTIILSLLILILSIKACTYITKKNYLKTVFILISFLIFLFYFIIFCFQQPMTCSMHFRYVSPFLLFGCIGLGLWWKKSVANHFRRIIKGILISLILIISISSTYLYLTCYLK